VWGLERNTLSANTAFVNLRTLGSCRCMRKSKLTTMKAHQQLCSYLCAQCSLKGLDVLHGEEVWQVATPLVPSHHTGQLKHTYITDRPRKTDRGETELVCTS